MDRLRILAWTTYREAVARPVFVLMAAVFGLLIYFSRYFTLFYFNETASALREVGIASVTFGAILMAVLGAGLTVRQDFDRLTVLMLFSKPIRRWEYLAGKFLGASMATLAGTVFLSLCFVYTLWVQEGLPELDRLTYEGLDLLRPGAVANTLSDFGRHTVVPLLSACLMGYAQAVILCAFAVAASVRWPLVVAAGVCLFVFLVGSLSGFVSYRMFGSEMTALHLAAVPLRALLPDLASFNVAHLVATHSASESGELSGRYVGAGVGYAILYAAAVIAAGSALFRKADVKA